MKILVFNVAENSFTLPSDMTGTEFKRFKSKYNFILNQKISETKARIKGCTKVMIDIDDMPVLSGSLNLLKSFMLNGMDKSKYTIKHWNLNRDHAKMFFTFECISALDASGYVNEIVKCEKV